MLALPPATAKWLVITGVQLMTVATVYSAETKHPTPYSKFAEESQRKSKTLPSRIGMLLIYSPGLAAAVWALVTGAGGMLDAPSIVSAMLFAHFLKRDLEVLFLHKYSGTTDLSTAGRISVFYFLWVVLINAAVRTDEAAASGPGPLGLGVCLFILGTAGNFYHHWLLAQMRGSGAASSGYSVPQGGLFDLVTMPHYFFELLAWYGIAAVANQLNVLLVAMGMTSYLCGRSVVTTRWYIKNVKGYPPDRRNIIPFIF